MVGDTENVATEAGSVITIAKGITAEIRDGKLVVTRGDIEREFSNLYEYSRHVRRLGGYITQGTHKKLIGLWQDSQKEPPLPENFEPRKEGYWLPNDKEDGQ